MTRNKKPKGWKNDPTRHGLASQGIKSTTKPTKYHANPTKNQYPPRIDNHFLPLGWKLAERNIGVQQPKAWEYKFLYDDEHYYRLVVDKEWDASDEEINEGLISRNLDDEFESIYTVTLLEDKGLDSSRILEKYEYPLDYEERELFPEEKVNRKAIEIMNKITRIEMKEGG